MTDLSSSPVLDDLTANLAAAVREASAARAGAALVAQYDTMRRQVEGAAEEIGLCMAALADPEVLQLPDDLQAALEERVAWLNAQIDKTREAVAQDPERVRQGSLWRDTRRAMDTLREELAAATRKAYESLLDEYAGDDQRLLGTLPPETPGARDYRVAIDRFEAVRDEMPASVEDVRRAIAVGRRIQELRERVEADAVPQEFQHHWRLVRGQGLPLAAFTDEFREWLTERGLAQHTVLRYQSD